MLDGMRGSPLTAPPEAPRFRLGFLTHVQGRGGSSATYRHAQELFVVADELGFDVGWVAQHHVPLGGGGLPSPWTFLAHAAARTKRIRLATAITILPLEHPLRLAEDVSVVDTLSGGRVEILLERALTADTALVQLRASKGLKVGAAVKLAAGHSASMLGRQGDLFHLRFSCEVADFFEAHGEIPLPPYISRQAERDDRERYQTVYARILGAVAAPTAGLHFDSDTFAALEARGIRHAFVTLHVGAGTFQPVRADDIEGHEMHEEYLDVSEAACAAIEATRAAGGRVIAVGTTVTRALEGCAAQHDGAVVAGASVTDLVLRAGFRLRVVDGILSGMHEPEASHFRLLEAFAPHDVLARAHAHAEEAGYLAHEFGDSSLILADAA